MVLTFDAIMARQNFIFVFDILTIGGESGGGGGRREASQLSSAHIKLRSVVFLEVQREVTAFSRINISKSLRSP